MQTHAHCGLPSFMRATIAAARSGRYGGYRTAGLTLGRHLDHQIPDSAETFEWQAEIDRVHEDLIHDDKLLTVWLRTSYPRILSLVPNRRIGAFVEGVRAGTLAER